MTGDRVLSTLTRLVARALDPHVAASALVDELVPYVGAVREQAGATRAVLFAWDREIGEFIKNVAIPCSIGGDDTAARDAVRTLYDTRWHAGTAPTERVELDVAGRAHAIIPLVAAGALVGALVLAEPDRARLGALGADPCAMLACMLVVIEHARVSNELDRQRLQLARSNRTLDRTLAELESQRETIERVNAELGAARRQVEERNAVLAQLNRELEQRVDEVGRARDLLQAALQRSEELVKFRSEFIANVTHELRTPLNGILGFAQVLDKDRFGDVGTPVRRYVQNIRESGEHMLSLVEDLLRFKELEHSSEHAPLECVQLRPVLLDAIQLINPEITKKSHHLKIDLPRALPHVMARPRVLKQVIVNLLSNATKYTPAGGDIEVRAQPAGDKVQIEVRDTGIGIAPEDHHKLFRVFQRLHQSEEQGTGLGLALAYSMVQTMNGELSFTSAVNQGSTFRVTLCVAA